MTVRLAGLDPCTHCGFCLQSCPTFLVTGDEADGPRGRIELMQEFGSGRIPVTDEKLRFHLDRCLSCRACETVCPPGVAYGAALEEVRTAMLTEPLPTLTRTVNYVMRDSLIRTAVLAGARAVRPLAHRLSGPSRLGFSWGMLASTRGLSTKGPAVPAATTVPGAGPDVVVFTGCIMSGLFSHVHEATVRVLEAHGARVTSVPDQQCCGALHAHSGQHQVAANLARTNIAAFRSRPDTVIVVNSAGCGALLKEYGRLLAGDALEAESYAFSDRVRDVSEVLVDIGVRPGNDLALRVAYDPPCHLEHAQGVVDPPLEVLRSIRGLEITPHFEAALCCGSAGSYSLGEPEMSRAVLDRKIASLAAAQPDVVATGNPGCIMQIGAGLRAAGLDIPVVHPVELLDLSYRTAGQEAQVKA